MYSGDCGRADDMAPLAEPGDVLLVEVSFGPGPVIDGVADLRFGNRNADEDWRDA